MNTIMSKKIRKAIVDIIILLCLIACINSTSVFEKSKESIENGTAIESVYYWGTLHCIIGIVFC